MAANDTLTAIAGLKVGHWSDPVGQTGCTVVLCPSGGCVASGLVLGGAPGTREMALLAPERLVERVDAVLLAGGSALGLAAADGVARYLLEQQRGFPTPFGRIPIVPAAVIFDLAQGDARAYPHAEAGYTAAAQASAAPVACGRIGVGSGATVAKLDGLGAAHPSGVGSACLALSGAQVAALAVSNALGNIVDPDSGAIIAGSANEGAISDRFAGQNTTLVVVATDAPLSKSEAYHLAHSAHIGIARVTRPSHTLHDGDTCFVLSTGSAAKPPLVALSAAVQRVVAQAIVRGVRAAQA